MTQCLERIRPTAVVIMVLAIGLATPLAAQVASPEESSISIGSSALETRTSFQQVPSSSSTERRSRPLLASTQFQPRLQPTNDTYEPLRRHMVEEQIRRRGIDQRSLLAALRTVPRHLFVPAERRSESYTDQALPIGFGQTISQPYIVAYMTELLDLDGDEKVLEIGTGSGYHTAVLSQVAGEVFTIEIIEELGRRADRLLTSLRLDNIKTKIGDGYKGWPAEAPFDAIIMSAAPSEIPQPLIDQLALGGKMVAPVGGYLQDLLVLTKTADGIETEKVTMVRFAPMTGEIEADADGR